MCTILANFTVDYSVLSHLMSQRKSDLQSHLLCASCVGSTTNTLHSLLAIFSSGMVVWAGGRWRGLPFGDSTAGRMADHAIALPDLEQKKKKSTWKTSILSHTDHKVIIYSVKVTL